MLKQLRKRTEGFTIIEVMIVLAIAGLILLIVFLAVPALQRNSRNTQRRNDAARILAAVQEWSNNNNGSLPGTAGTTYDFNDGTNGFTNVTPKTSIYDVTTTGVNSKAKWYNQSSPNTDPGDPGDIAKIRVANNATCNTAGTGVATTGASSRSIVVLFDIETSSGTNNGTEQCVGS